MREKNLIREYYDVHDGRQKIYRFDNGLGASVVMHSFSYGGDQGLWEIGILEWTEDSYELTRLIEDTGDVKGWLTDEAVDIILERIANINLQDKKTYVGVFDESNS